jgi:hypothetical protein
MESLFSFPVGALSSPTTCRFIPAHSGWPTSHPETPISGSSERRALITRSGLLVNK